MRHQVAPALGRIDEVGHAEVLAPGLLALVQVDADDHVGAGEPQALDDIQAHAPETEDDRFRPRLDLGRVDDGADRPS